MLKQKKQNSLTNRRIRTSCLSRDVPYISYIFLSKRRKTKRVLMALESHLCLSQNTCLSALNIVPTDCKNRSFNSLRTLALLIKMRGSSFEFFKLSVGTLSFCNRSFHDLCSISSTQTVQKSPLFQVYCPGSKR